MPMSAPRPTDHALSIGAHAVGAMLLLAIAGFIDYAIVLGENYTQAWYYDNLPDTQIPSYMVIAASLTGFSACAARLLRPRSELASVGRVAAALVLAVPLCGASNVLFLVGTSTQAAYHGSLAFLAAGGLCLAAAVASIALLGRTGRQALHDKTLQSRLVGGA